MVSNSKLIFSPELIFYLLRIFNFKIRVYLNDLPITVYIHGVVGLKMKETFTLSPFGPIIPIAPRIPWGPWINKQVKQMPGEHINRTQNSNKQIVAWKTLNSLIKHCISPSVLGLQPPLDFPALPLRPRWVKKERKSFEKQYLVNQMKHWAANLTTL